MMSRLEMWVFKTRVDVKRRIFAQMNRLHLARAVWSDQTWAGRPAGVWKPRKELATIALPRHLQWDSLLSLLWLSLRPGTMGSLH